MGKPLKHKRTKPKQGRSGCMLCKPNKNSHNKTADRMRENREAFKYEGRAAGEELFDDIHDLA